MAGTVSAGVLLFRLQGESWAVLIAHPGGPFWRNRNTGAWSIPKGLVEAGEDLFQAALREFAEETGVTLEGGGAIELGSTELRSGKTVVAWAIQGDLDPDVLDSNLVRLEYPRGSGRYIEFPEIDEVRWCPLETAAELLNPAQVVFLDRLKESLDHTQ